MKALGHYANKFLYSRERTMVLCGIEVIPYLLSFDYD